MARPLQRGDTDPQLANTTSPQILSKRTFTQPRCQHNTHSTRSQLVMPAIRDNDTQIAYAAQQRLDGYSEAIRHVMDRKTRFDRQVLDSKEGENVFKEGQLVQIYRSDISKSIGLE